MEGREESESGMQQETRTAAQRRAEIRRRKLLMNSEDRMNKIVGFSKNEADSEAGDRQEPRFHLDLEQNESWLLSGSPKAEFAAGCGELPERTSGEESRQKPRGDDRSTPQRGLHKYLSRFDEAMNLRGQLAAEKVTQDGPAEAEELDSFRLFRLVVSAVLAVIVRVFVCQYLSIFAPFLTLQLGFMGLNKYFPKVEKKSRTTVLTAALLLSGIPAEVITRSMNTYRKMSDVFSDLCVYFFTFVTCHELLLLFGHDGS